MTISTRVEVEERPLVEIRPYWRNPRVNDGRAVAAVKRSITEFGFQQPIVVDEDGVIIAGHARYKALLELGAESVPVIVAHISADKAKAYRIADNKTSEIAIWDTDLLIQELRELDLSLMQTFFTDQDLAATLQQTAGAVNFRETTQGDVNDAANRINSRFDGTNAAVDAGIELSVGQVELVCPHCAGRLYMNRSDI